MKTHRLISQILAFFIVFLFCSCKPTMKSNYYQYYLGTIDIDDPVMVSFANSDTLYVCPDSVLYCCRDSNWTNRRDVYPYLPIVENTEQTPTHLPYFQLSRYDFYNKGYHPYYKCEEQPVEDVTIYHFYYNLTKFELYMQAKGGYWYDLSDPNRKDVSADCLDGFAYSTEYRMAIKHHYSLVQVLKLRHLCKASHRYAQK